MTRRVAVVGAGIGGIGMGIRLKAAGVPFTIFEKGGEVGGTWRENHYPGLRIDVPGPIYTYSTDRAVGWTHIFATGAQTQQSIVEVFDRHGLREHTRFNARVAEARWEDDAWTLVTGDGDKERFEVVVQATGFLHNPRMPDIPGLETFEGECFHSARWDHDVELTGARIGVIGNGSTGVQIVSELAGKVRHLTMFQRTPQWIFPMHNMRLPGFVTSGMARSERLSDMLARLTQAASDALLGEAARKDGPQRRLLGWLARQNLERSVKDPALRRKLTPSDQPLCKRPIVSTIFYRAIQKPRTELVTEPIERICPEGVVTADGRVHELDVLALATGFQAHDFMRPMRVVGEDGLVLDDAWAHGPSNYRTIGVAGFPNMFMIMGPHSPLVHISIHSSIELQSDYVMQTIRRMEELGLVSLAPREEACGRWLDEVAGGMNGTVWSSGCSSWYLGDAAFPVLWPFTRRRWIETLRTPVWSDYTERARTLETSAAE
ncbi:MAG: hypothetical protein QOG62_2524 [Thermoleophilaceae bacterium]|jgi:cation diffusion facilitator CzcD-associated flavoprotein CzcO|nr:hypothetical protein [Thermoleophilaceae bacterium]